MSIKERIQQLEAQNDGKSIGLIIEKYWFQRCGWNVPSGEPWAESEAQAERYRENPMPGQMTVSLQVLNPTRSFMPSREPFTRR